MHLINQDKKSKIGNIGVAKTSDNIQIKNKMPNPSQEPPVSSKALNEDLKDITINLIQIKINMTNPSQEPSASPNSLNEDLKDMYALCTFKIKIKSQNLDQ